jgi:hypothetical protein
MKCWKSATSKGWLHIARKVRYHDEWDPKVEPYDPYGPGQPIIQDDGNLEDEPAVQIGTVSGWRLKPSTRCSRASSFANQK